MVGIVYTIPVVHVSEGNDLHTVLCGKGSILLIMMCVCVVPKTLLLYNCELVKLVTNNIAWDLLIF